MNFLIIVVNLLISSFLVQSEWQLKKDKNNIKVFLRSKSSDVQEYLAETIIDSDLKSISSIILDFDKSYKWMYKLTSSKILEKNSENLYHVYFTVEMNWPLKNRDLVSDVKIFRSNNKITIDLNSKPNYINMNQKYIRIIDTRSIWNLIKISENKTKVTLQSYAVIEGIPNIITDLFILESPLFSLSNLREKF